MKNLLFFLIACTCALTMPSCNSDVASKKYDLDAFGPLNPHELFKNIEVVVLDSIPVQPISLIIKMDFHRANA